VGGPSYASPRKLEAVRRAAYRLRHETLTEAERLALQQAAYLSPASDPRLMAQVEKSPLWDEGDLTETVSQATPLVVQGLDDRRAPPGNGWALRDRVGDRVRVVDIPQAGYFLVLEQPQAVAGAVTAFLREP
jgi:pimeloyl-ACP methyl ester carboxylesterase